MGLFELLFVSFGQNFIQYQTQSEKDMDSSALGSEDLKTYQDSLDKMVTAYNTQKIVSRDGKSLFSLEPEIYEAIESAAQVTLNPSYFKL